MSLSSGPIILIALAVTGVIAYCVFYVMMQHSPSYASYDSTTTTSAPVVTSEAPLVTTQSTRPLIAKVSPAQPEYDEQTLVFAETLFKFFRSGVFDSYAIFSSYVANFGFPALLSEQTYSRLMELVKTDQLTEVDVLEAIA